jgi:hypothetical protein
MPAVLLMTWSICFWRFPERARVLIGANIDDPVLHVCGGAAKFYPYSGGFGPHDQTLDIAPSTEPDFLQDAREPLPMNAGKPWRAVLIDPPYSPEDADHYELGAGVYPSPYAMVTNALNVVAVGGKVGLIHYSLPKQPKNSKFVACIGIVCGFGNRIRVFSVFERMK